MDCWKAGRSVGKMEDAGWYKMEKNNAHFFDKTENRIFFPRHHAAVFLSMLDAERTLEVGAKKFHEQKTAGPLF